MKEILTVRMYELILTFDVILMYSLQKQFRLVKFYLYFSENLDISLLALNPGEMAAIHLLFLQI